jgi:hypothetical protein
MAMDTVLKALAEAVTGKTTVSGVAMILVYMAGTNISDFRTFLVTCAMILGTALYTLSLQWKAAKLKIKEDYQGDIQLGIKKPPEK